MRSGTSSSASACWISSSARLRVVRSLARLVLWSASAWAALLATVSWRSRLSPRCGTRIATLLPRRSLSSSSSTSASGRQRRHQHLARDGVAPVVGADAAVELEQEVLDELGRAALVGAVGHPAALPADPAAADVEDLHGDLERVLGERDHVGVGAVAQHHRLLLQRLGERTEVVAQPGGLLEVERLGGGVHLALDALA